jgi:hypothetical protein
LLIGSKAELFVELPGPGHGTPPRPQGAIAEKRSEIGRGSRWMTEAQTIKDAAHFQPQSVEAPGRSKYEAVAERVRRPMAKLGAMHYIPPKTCLTMR